MTRLLRLTTIVAALTLTSIAQAQTAIPTPEQFLGYRIGERFTPHHRILAYFEELTRRSDLITMHQIGESYEQRPLMLATLTGAKNRARLEAIRRDVSSLARGETEATRVADVTKSTPAIVWLGFGVHGNESSSAEAGMMVAHQLLTEPALLENLVVLIDPLENPDGRERYIEWYRRTRGATANSNPDSFEHIEPWPGGRFNHYMIDMNRDWAFQSQRETQARVAEYRRWNPQVIVDFHEMSFQSSYFFPPDAKPMNANLPKDAERWLETFGKANADEFSKRGWTFFVGERFDLFYPGYGDSWPSLRGAIGMTYEVAGGGRGGTTVEKADGTVLTLGHRALQHFTTGIATVRTAAQHRSELLRYSYDAARANIENGRNTFVLLPDSPNFLPLVEKLQQQDIRVEMLSAPATLRGTRLDREVAESRTFPAGSAVISTRQAFGGLANTLLEKTPALDKAFVDEQREKAQADEPDDFYDLTTWSLPLAMNVEAWSITGPVAGTSAFVAPAVTAFRPAAYGYLVDGNDPNVYRFVGRLIGTPVRFSVSDDVVPIGARSFARGSLIILKGNNEPTLDATLASLSKEAAVSVVPLESGWLGGNGFGSEKIRPVKNPKIALVGGPGSFATSYGMLWHTLDVDTPIPHTTLAAESIRNLDLDRYEVIILPDGAYSDRLGKRGIEKLKAWVNDGGTLVAVKGASSVLREKDVEISRLKAWEPPKPKEGEKPVGSERYNDFRVPGSAFRTTMNTRSYLTFGLPRPPAVLIEGTGAYLPLPRRADNILTVTEKDSLISGIAWDESIDRVKGSVYVVSEPSGRGQVVTFADDPHFRLFWRATLPIFLNAVLYGPSFPR